jgi:hypothetical protein
MTTMVVRLRLDNVSRASPALFEAVLSCNISKLCIKGLVSQVWLYITDILVIKFMDFFGNMLQSKCLERQ